MPKISIECPSCSSRYQVDTSHVGKRVRCKKCDSKFVIESEPKERQGAENHVSDRQDQGAQPGAEIAEVTAEGNVPAVWKVGDVILNLYEVTGELGEGG